MESWDWHYIKKDSTAKIILNFFKKVLDFYIIRVYSRISMIEYNLQNGGGQVIIRCSMDQKSKMEKR